jgi:hypothetical protein
VDVTSDEIRSSRFQGTRHVYDRREVDAFLHRTAATVEVYERKLAVTQAHLESLEKALDLAHGRARSVRSREARIAELEAALAAAQHNYESAATLLESQNTETDEHQLVLEARRRAEALLAEATEESARLRSEAERTTSEAVEGAALVAASAQTDADEMRKKASLEHAAMLEDLAQARLDAKAALEAEMETKRTAAVAELEAEKVRFAGDTAAAQASLEARLAKAERKAAKAQEKSEKQLQAAQERAALAEGETAKLQAEIERVVASAEAERQVFMEDADRMFEEAAARAEAERAAAAPEATILDDGAAEELTALRHQVAQLRTALADVQKRFSDVSALSAEELELSAALVGLDLADAEVIDLTAAAATDAPESEDAAVESEANVTVKARWAETQPMHAAPRGDVDGSEDGSPEAEAAAAGESTWRDGLESAGRSESESDNGESPVIGFYERRLAGLRARLKDAAPDDH